MAWRAAVVLKGSVLVKRFRPISMPLSSSTRRVSFCKCRAGGEEAPPFQVKVCTPPPCVTSFSCLGTSANGHGRFFKAIDWVVS